MNIVKSYLFAYNCIAFLAWAYILGATINHLAAHPEDGWKTLYKSIGPTLLAIQTATILETIHSALGLVKSSAATSLLQWLGRDFCLWAVVYIAPPAQRSWAFLLTVLCWSLAEVIRYPYYASALVGATPYWLHWLRYSMFIVLYPGGFFGEVGCLWESMDFVKEYGIGSVKLPNRHNFAFDYPLVQKIMLLVYVGGAWSLYSYMLAQRKKQLAPVPTATPKAS